MILPQHEALISDSAIAPAVAEARGYFSATKKVEIKDLGFSDLQCRVPALVLPVHGVTGEITLHQIRPDTPRADREGKAVKYDMPPKARMTLDVHPAIRQHLGNPKRPLFVTEGIRKADSAVSHNLCCVALLGVWNWRGSNTEGGKVALPEWEYIALNDRETYIVFDSDVMTKPEVHKALVRLKAFLEHRKALVKVIYLEPAADGSKVGLDDFFASGNVLQTLLAKATTTLQQPPEPEHPFPYKETPRGLVWIKPTQNGPVDTPLCNFTARILSDLVEDDGVETKRLFEIEAQQRDRRAVVKVSAEKFASMTWPAEALGSHAILAPGNLVKDHARVAIQLFSQDATERHVYAHLGWRKIGERWVYLHAAGAIGESGTEASIEVSVPPALERYVLADPPGGEELKTAIRASLYLLDSASPEITYPLLSAVYRAVLGDADFSLHLAGPTGVGKTELAALAQQHHGAEIDARNLPGSWTSTGNSLEALAFTAKDCLLTVDDFAPTGSTTDVQRFHREADRILRAQGNRAGRLRMRSDATLKPAKPPRGLILSTGEDIPKGQSLRSRVFTLEVSAEDVRWSTVSACQDHARQGLYAQSLAGFVSWLAPRYEQIKSKLRAEINDLRQHTVQAQHKRTPDIVANLALGFWYFLEFSLASGAITKEEHEEFYEKCWNALSEAANAQAKHQEASEPARRFIELMSAALTSGRAHLADPSGTQPYDPEAWGWRSEIGQLDYHSKGERIGWVTGADVYLDPDTSFAVVQRFAKDQGDAFPITAQTLYKRLKERGILASTDTAKETLKIRRVIEGKSTLVLHLHKNIFLNGLSTYKKPDIPDIDPNSSSESQFSRENVGFLKTRQQAKPDI